MDGLAVLALLVLGLVIVAPFIAFSALGKAKRALADLAEHKALIEGLSGEFAQLRAARGEPPAALTAANDVEPAAAEPPPVGPEPVGTPTEAAQPGTDIRASAADNPSIADDAAAPPPQEAATEEAPVEPSPEAAPGFAEAARDEAAIDIAQAPIEAPKARDFEESIGSRWAVWVGGVALALGGLFLVRYSIEMGVFGPGVRLTMGALFAIACGVASEYVRRSDMRLSLGRLPPTQIPSILAGVSLLSGFGVVYAAHAFYGFIGPTLAFTLMGVIGVGALAISLIHGPLFGLFGLVGSYVTPLLVSSTAPAFASLSIFVAAITCVAFFLHARRPERIVTLGAVAGHGVWTSLIAAYEPGGKTWSSILLILASCLGLALLKEIPALRARVASFGDATHPHWFAKRFDATAFTALAVPLVLSGAIWTAFGGPTAPHVAILATVVVAFAAAARHEDLSPLAPLAGAAATGMILLWPTTAGPFGVTPRLIIDLVRLSLGVDTGDGIAWTAIAFAAIAAGPTFHALRMRRGAGDGDAASRGCLAFASALTPVCIMLATALRMNGFNRSVMFALIALVLTIALFSASETVLAVERHRTKSRDNPLAFIGSAAYAAGAAIALGLAIAFALRETWLFVGLAIAASGVALVAALRPIPLLRSMSGALATAAFGRFVWQPFLTDVGSWPLVNWLILAYALPALCFAVGAILLSGRDDRPRRLHEAFAIFFGAAFILLEVRQFFAGPDLVPSWSLLDGHWSTPRNRLFEEVAAQVAAIGLIGAVLQQLHRRAERRTFLVAADLAAMALVAVALAGLCGILNPLFDGTLVLGSPIFNRLLLYAIVGGLLIALAFGLKQGGTRSRMSDALDAIGAVLVALGAILIVRHAFAGPELVVASEDSVGYFEVVTTIIVLLALTAASRIWLAAGGGRIVDLIVRSLAFISAGVAVLALALWRNPIVDLSGVAGPILFNRILWGYGAVTLAFAAAGRWMREDAPDVAKLFRRVAGGFAVLGAFLLMRHGFHGRLLISDEQVTLAEAGCYAAIAFIMAIILSVKGSYALIGAPRPVSPVGAAAASTAIFAMFPGFAANPVVTSAPLSGVMILDNALVGYLAPALLAYVAARWAREHATGNVARRIYGAAAIAGGLIYLIIEVRRWFVGPDLMAESGDEAELYAYSAVVILYGVTLLALGFRVASKDLRLAAMAVITLAVCKVFLIDMAGLQGLLRALSFIGLGGSLVAIGLVYQRLLQRETLKPPAPTAAPTGS